MGECQAHDVFWKEVCNPLPVTISVDWGKKKRDPMKVCLVLLLQSWYGL